MKKSARISEKLISPGLPGVQVATRLVRYRNGGLTKLEILKQRIINTWLQNQDLKRLNECSGYKANKDQCSRGSTCDHKHMRTDLLRKIK